MWPARKRLSRMANRRMEAAGRSAVLQWHSGESIRVRWMSALVAAKETGRRHLLPIAHCLLITNNPVMV